MGRAIKQIFVPLAFEPCGWLHNELQNMFWIRWDSERSDKSIVTVIYALFVRTSPEFLQIKWNKLRSFVHWCSEGSNSIVLIINGIRRILVSFFLNVYWLCLSTLKKKLWNVSRMSLMKVIYYGTFVDDVIAVLEFF